MEACLFWIITAQEFKYFWICLMKVLMNERYYHKVFTLQCKAPCGDCY